MLWPFSLWIGYARRVVSYTLRQIGLVCCLLLAACTHIPSPAVRRQLADTLAHQHAWQGIHLREGRFDLVAYVPANPIRSKALSVYIEGDGFAWITNDQPSTNPTPLDPLALKLALAQPEGNAAYLARPCQYVDDEASNCSSRYWTQLRFAPEVVTAMNQAIDALKQRFGATRLTLVGYSGGGAVAALVAARRDDVTRLITVAGNLDSSAWAEYHRVSPLSGSLNPTDEVEGLQRIRQWDFVGQKDRDVPPALVQQFADRFPAAHRPTVVVEPGFDHHCCWVQAWPTIWQTITAK